MNRSNMEFLPRGSAGGEISSHGMRLCGERARMSALSRNVRGRCSCAPGPRRPACPGNAPLRRECAAECAARAPAGPHSWQTGGMSMTDPVTAPDAINRTVGEPCVLLKLGEIFLKGRNRQQFVRMQQANVRAAVRGTGRAGGTHGARGGAGAAGRPRRGRGGRAHDRGRARGGDGPGRRAGRRRAGDRPGLPGAAGGQDAGGGHRRRDRADQPGQRHVRGPRAPPRQALPPHLRAAQRRSSGTG